MNIRLLNILFSGYFIGACAYIVGNAYIDSKRMVKKWRSNQLDDYDKRRYVTELNAVKDEMLMYIPVHIMCSFMWPVFTPLMAIPYLVSNNKKD